MDLKEHLDMVYLEGNTDHPIYLTGLAKLAGSIHESDKDLTKNELKKAIISRMLAYYDSPDIIKKLWDELLPYEKE